MYKLPNTIEGLLIGAVLLAVALYVASGRSGDGAGHAAAFVRSIRERERLGQDRELLRQKAETSQAVIDQLIVGRLSLGEAAAALHEEDEGHPQRLRLPAFKNFLHLPHQERYMHILLVRADNALEGDSRRAEVMNRLHGEFEVASGPLYD
jgi:hypothetical protein